MVGRVATSYRAFPDTIFETTVGVELVNVHPNGRKGRFPRNTVDTEPTVNTFRRSTHHA